MGSAQFLMLLHGVFATSSVASPEQFIEVPGVEEVTTVAGALRIEKSRQGQGIYDIVLAGKVIGGGYAFAAGIDYVYPAKERAGLVLIGFDTGGSGCPLTYRLVEIRLDGGTKVTPEFGNCNKIESITRNGDAWYFHIFGNMAARETWEYREGKLKKIGRGPRKKGP